MKFLLDVEDAVVGVIMGLLVIGLSGRYYSLELNPVFYIIGFGALIIFIVFDLISEMFNLGAHPLYLLALVVHNIIDFIISAAFISKYMDYSIPFITENLVPLLDNPTVLFYIGVFLVIGNALWIVTLPLYSN